jgi:hypothetical protein
MTAGGKINESGFELASGLAIPGLPKNDGTSSYNQTRSDHHHHKLELAVSNQIDKANQAFQNTESRLGDKRSAINMKVMIEMVF